MKQYMEIKKTDEEKIEKDFDVQKHEYVKSSENVCDLDEIKEQVAVMMPKEDSEAKSEKKITRLQLILKLLEEEEEEQSMGKEKLAGGGMPIRKMSEIKPPDGTADDSEQISTKPAGSGMQIDIMQTLNLLMVQLMLRVSTHLVNLLVVVF